MKRRQFISASIVGGVVLGLGGLVAIRPGRATNQQPLTITAALATLKALSTNQLTASRLWTPQQIFSHCAQSIEYSISGFPQQRPAWFKSTVGHLAFSVFAAQGAMSHGLSDSIPGAPAFATDETNIPALNRLIEALITFEQHAGPLAPHFAYGALSRADYELAHVMHLYNHLEEIVS
ncbi:MAG: DUF1569 domain-containing protein [Immundisolibacteraceae bacterium]|nr:DUF1569 domain-containing protein [Immundisolibacteraceae bacterium]